MAEQHVLERFAPAHVVVDHEGEVVHYSPRTGKYLEAPVGLPSRQLLTMARKGLRLDLRSVHPAVEPGSSATVTVLLCTRSAAIAGTAATRATWCRATRTFASGSRRVGDQPGDTSVILAITQSYHLVQVRKDRSLRCFSGSRLSAVGVICKKRDGVDRLVSWVGPGYEARLVVWR